MVKITFQTKLLRCEEQGANCTQRQHWRHKSPSPAQMAGCPARNVCDGFRGIPAPQSLCDWSWKLGPAVHLQRILPVNFPHSTLGGVYFYPAHIKDKHNMCMYGFSTTTERR